jgi:hypothetical protein
MTDAPKLTKPEQAVMEAAATLLRESNLAIHVEALMLAGQWRQRRSVRWPAVREALEERLQRTLIAIRLADLQQSILQLNPAACNPIEVSDEIAELLRQGGGTSRAAYGFFGRQNVPDQAGAGE